MGMAIIDGNIFGDLNALPNCNTGAKSEGTHADVPSMKQFLFLLIVAKLLALPKLTSG